MSQKIKFILLFIIGFSIYNVSAQETTQKAEKEIYAKNFIGKTAPSLNAEGWILVMKAKKKFLQ